MSSVLALGSGGSGQLGIGRTEEALGVATACMFDTLPGPTSIPLNVVGGGNHSLMLFDDGSIYAAGDNSNGACGHDLHERLLSFHKIEIPGVSSIKSIAATWTASILVTNDERVFVCGEGIRGELGMGNLLTKALKPVEIDGFPPPGHLIVHLSASFRHIVAVLRDNNSGQQSLWGWGVGRHGELGDDAQKMPSGVLWKQSLITFPHEQKNKASLEPKHVQCGRDFSFILGGIDDGMHGLVNETILGADRHQIAPLASLALSGLVVLYGTWSSIYLHLPDSGRVVIQGKDRNCAFASEAFPWVTALKTGSEHAIAKLRDGRIVACGWNEHLNCGEKYAQGSSNDFVYYVLDESSMSYPLGCGCATTFFVRAGPAHEYASGPAALDTMPS